MPNKNLVYLVLLLFGLNTTYVQAADETLTEAIEPFTKQERLKIGQAVCEDSKINLTEEGLSCRSCPSYTGQPDDPTGLHIEKLIRGQFTRTGSNEILIDTSGCEAHFANFGGAILLRKPPLGLPANATGKQPDKNAFELQYYSPGYRLNDCLAFEKQGLQTVLVCNEFWQGQGEMIGHVSVMEISSRSITRWRLFRWYDNTSADSEQVISIVPEQISKLSLRNGKQDALKVTLKLIQTSRQAYEKNTDDKPALITLMFVREGQRFFADDDTRARLGEISTLTRNISD